MNIYVTNLPASITEDELRDLFSPYGQVKSIHIVHDKQTRIADGTAYVFMDSQVEGEQAIAGLEGSDYKGQSLEVREAPNGDFPTGDFW